MIWSLHLSALILSFPFPNTFHHGFIGTWGNHQQALPTHNLSHYGLLSSIVFHKKFSKSVFKVNDSCSCDQIRVSLSLFLTFQKGDYLKQITWVEMTGCAIWLCLMVCTSNSMHHDLPKSFHTNTGAWWFLVTEDHFC